MEKALVCAVNATEGFTWRVFVSVSAKLSAPDDVVVVVIQLTMALTVGLFCFCPVFAHARADIENEVDVGPSVTTPKPTDPCAEAVVHCQSIRCPYGMEQ